MSQLLRLQRGKGPLFTTEFPVMVKTHSSSKTPLPVPSLQAQTTTVSEVSCLWLRPSVCYWGYSVGLFRDSRAMVRSFDTSRTGKCLPFSAELFVQWAAGELLPAPGSPLAARAGPRAHPSARGTCDEANCAADQTQGWPAPALQAIHHHQVRFGRNIPQATLPHSPGFTTRLVRHGAPLSDAPITGLRERRQIRLPV